MTDDYQHIIKDIAELTPYANNARTHSAEQVTQIAESIKAFGFTNPILIDEQGGVIAGHGRILAAKELGRTKVPCIVITGLSESQQKALVIADNQLALNADWDIDILMTELQELKDNDFDIDLMGFDDEFLDESNITDDLNNPINEQDYTEVFEVVVECDNEREQERIFHELQQKGMSCRILSM